MDPAAHEYSIARFNGDALDNPPAGGGGYTGFPATATLIGAGEDFGYDIYGYSIQLHPMGQATL